MITRFRFIILFLAAAIALSSCVSKKRKRGEDVSKFNKFYHNLNSKYNGIFNANELMEEAHFRLESTHKDDYSQILPVFPYTVSANAKAVAPEMDIVIEKVTRVAIVHEVGEYVDDGYVMMGQAQFLKQDYETAEETFEYFREEFNPKNPYGRAFESKKKSRKELKKERAAKQKEKEKKRAEDKKEREKAKKLRDKEKAAEKKARDKAREQREKEKKAARKQQKKSSAKSKKKKRGKPGSKKRPVKTVSQDTTSTIAKPPVKKVTPKVEKPTKEEEEEEEDLDDKKKEEKIPQDETEYSEGLLWLAKTYIERDNYSSADYILKQLDKRNLKPHVREEIAPTMAHLYIRKGDLDQAIPHLDAAIETSGSKKAKARYAYITGQIQQQLGNREAAMKAFAQVNKYRPSFDMQINAELSEMRYAMESGERSADSVVKALEKMLKEAKYIGYEDRIYYTIGTIKEEQGLTAEAIAAYTQSNINNTANASLKVESYYAMAQLTFEQEDYLNSKYYYDSTLQSMQTTDLRYEEVQTLADNLKDIAYNIEVIVLQDSLISLAQLSDEEIREVATEIARNNAAAEPESTITETAPAKGSSSDRIFGTSDNWPYSVKRVERGKQKFKNKWGDIPLVDNWRRSASINVGYDDELTGGSDAPKEIEVSKKEVQEVLKSIPRNPNEINDAKLKLQKAMFDLGVLYRDKLQKQDKSIATLEDLLTRFPDTQHKLDAYYSIYLSYLELGDEAGAARYLAKIDAEFGDTSLAKRLANPQNATKMTEEERVMAFYEDTYDLFDKGRYEQVSERVNTVKSAYDNDYGLAPKFSLLNAMSVGKLNGKEAYKAALSDLITRHANTLEATRAKEILRFLKGDDEAFEQLDIKEVDDIFKKEDERRHYILLITNGVGNDDFVQAKIAVSNYNKKYHKLDKLQLNESFLDKEAGTRVLLVRPFKDKAKAMKYYDEVTKAKEEYVGRGDLDFELYAATQGNYRRIVQERSTTKYRVFFSTYYLGQQD